MIISDVEIPSVLCVGTNIPEQSGKREPAEKARQDQALWQVAEDEHKNAWPKVRDLQFYLLYSKFCPIVPVWA